MEQLVRRIPQTGVYEAKRNLLMDKIQHYRARASVLMADESSTKPNNSVILENDETEKPTAPLCSPRSVQSDLVDSRASQANTKLALALDLDETGKLADASKAYMEAAELYLQALEVAEKHMPTSARMESVSAVLKRRLESTLNRVEKLKNPTTISAAREGKARSRSTSPIPPSSSASLTQEEISVLKRSSMVASGLFLPWSEYDAIQLSKEAATLNVPLFKDPDGLLPLSPKQKQRFRQWARPADIVRIRHKLGITRKVQTPALVRSITPYTIKQQYVTDCSFIASLCICAAFERRFRKLLVTSIIFPQLRNGALMLNPSGKYMVKLWLNGVARCVVVDDYFPIDEYGNLLCSHTTSPSAPYLELWVCLIEKAYMKLCGGYDFPGSNSGVDLFSLTGWIPERIMFAADEKKVKDYETPAERAWERIASASSYGDCLITVSSQLELPNHESDALGLVMGHAYAVLSVVETRKGLRLLMLKNPWAHKSWKGRYSSQDKASWQDPELQKELGYSAELASQQDDGVFWICWEDILKYFRNFHLSWNPFLFPYRITTHGFWRKTQGPLDDTFNLGENPQYVLALSDAAIQRQATIWVLISRHVTKQEQAGAEVNDFLTVHIHRTSSHKERIWYPGKSGKCVLAGAYTNNPQVLVRYDVTDQSDKYLVLVLSQYQRSDDLGYTLSCYCTENFSFGQPQKSLPHSQEVSGALNAAGGPIASATFIHNAAVALSIPDSGSTLEFRVSVTKTVSLNILVFQTQQYGQGMRGATGKPVIDSGNYRHGFVVTERKMLPPGSYVAVVSNFHGGVTAPFRLSIHSSRAIQVKSLPSDS
jgi:calpain-7